MDRTKPNELEAKASPDLVEGSGLANIIENRTLKSPILQTAARYLVPLLLMFSVFVFLRGHNEPGGGFIGGLVAAAALALYAIAFGAETTWQSLPIRPRFMIGLGLAAAVVAGLLPLLVGEPFLTGLWTDFEVPAIGKLGTPLLFDVGVFLVVIGVTTLIVLLLMEQS
jgi:multicomponent Na+:H+ antiporter subunit B